jgi:tetratricopeptide (TPR) repeat protein
MLKGLGLEHVEPLTQGLARYTGGNPLFITETLKHLLQTNTLEQGLPSRLSPPGKVATLVTRRLSRLSLPALNLARAAAVAGTAFDLKLAAFVLERPALELAEAHAELEAAQVLRGQVFVHDLVFEATLSSIPNAIGQVLHTRTAQHLESVAANPVLIAVHWEASGDGDQAAQWLVRAADSAEDLGLYEDMVKHLERATAVSSSPEVRLSAQVRLANALGPFGKNEAAIGLANTVLSQSRIPETRLRALNVLQNTHHNMGRLPEAESYAQQGLELALGIGDLDQANGLRFAIARSSLRSGRYAQAVQLLEQILPHYHAQPLGTDVLQVLTALGTSLCFLGQHDRALPLLHEAHNMADVKMGIPAVMLSTSTLLYGLLCTGEPHSLLEESERLLETEGYSIADHLRNNLALTYLRLGRLEEAKHHYQILTNQARDPNFLCAAWAWLAHLEPENTALALGQATTLYPQTITPALRFAAVQAAVKYGTQEQRAWGLAALQNLERDTVPWLFLPEFDGLVAKHKM